jgi:hypothetical protein
MSILSVARRTCSLLLMSLALIGGAQAAEPEQTTHDGLQLTPSKNADLLYTRPGATLAGYTKVAMLDCTVAFRKNWQRDQNTAGLRVTSADMDRIKKSLAEDFRKVFTEELTKGGYAITDQAGEDVLILRPALVDLDVTAPDVNTAGRSRSFSTSAGSMTLYVELFDGATGEVLARVADRAKGRDSGRMMWQNSVTNRAEADRMLRKWAQLAVKALDNAKAASPTPAATP